MKSKKIGIVGWNTGDNSFGITKAYAEFFAQYGTLYILTPMTGIVEGLDLLVLPGGPDLSPSFSGVIPSFRTSNNDVMKEYFFTQNLPQYVEAGVPIFGICLGMQQIAVHFGASMVQNAPYLNYSTETRADRVDTLEFHQNYDYLHKFRKNTNKVNSLHHQIVDSENFPDCLEVVAVEKDDRNIEIIKHNQLPIWGVQYHPEELGFDIISHRIIEKLLTVNEQIPEEV